MNAIYVLVDPETGRVGYVGRTDYPDRRWHDHWASKTPFGTEKERWLWSLYEKGVEREMKIVEEVPGHAAKGHEHLWMVRLAVAGARLTNSELPSEARALLEGVLVEARVAYEREWYGLDLSDYQADTTAKVPEEDLIASGVGHSQRERIRILLDIIRDLDSGDTPEEAAAKEDILERAAEEGISEQQVEDTLKMLLTQDGTVYRPGKGKDHYRLVRG